MSPDLNYTSLDLNSPRSLQTQRTPYGGHHNNTARQYDSLHSLRSIFKHDEWDLSPDCAFYNTDNHPSRDSSPVRMRRAPLVPYYSDFTCILERHNSPEVFSPSQSSVRQEVESSHVPLKGDSGRPRKFANIGEITPVKTGICFKEEVSSDSHDDPVLPVMKRGRGRPKGSLSKTTMARIFNYKDVLQIRMGLRNSSSLSPTEDHVQETVMRKSSVNSQNTNKSDLHVIEGKECYGRVIHDNQTSPSSPLRLTPAPHLPYNSGFPCSVDKQNTPDITSPSQSSVRQEAESFNVPLKRCRGRPKKLTKKEDMITAETGANFGKIRSSDPHDGSVLSVSKSIRGRKLGSPNKSTITSRRKSLQARMLMRNLHDSLISTKDQENVMKETSVGLRNTKTNDQDLSEGNEYHVRNINQNQTSLSKNPSSKHEKDVFNLIQENYEMANDNPLLIHPAEAESFSFQTLCDRTESEDLNNLSRGKNHSGSEKYLTAGLSLMKNDSLKIQSHGRTCLTQRSQPFDNPKQRPENSQTCFSNIPSHNKSEESSSTDDPLSCESSLVGVAEERRILESTKSESEDKIIPPSSIVKDPLDSNGTESMWISVRSDLFHIDSITRENLANRSKNLKSSIERSCCDQSKVFKINGPPIIIRKVSSRPKENEHCATVLLGDNDRATTSNKNHSRDATGMYHDCVKSSKSTLNNKNLRLSSDRCVSNIGNLTSLDSLPLNFSSDNLPYHSDVTCRLERNNSEIPSPPQSSVKQVVKSSPDQLKKRLGRPKKKRLGRPRKNATISVSHKEGVSSDANEDRKPPLVKRRPGRPRGRSNKTELERLHNYKEILLQERMRRRNNHKTTSIKYETSDKQKTNREHPPPIKAQECQSKTRNENHTGSSENIVNKPKSKASNRIEENSKGLNHIKPPSPSGMALTETEGCQPKIYCENNKSENFDLLKVQSISITQRNQPVEQPKQSPKNSQSNGDSSKLCKISLNTNKSKIKVSNKSYSNSTGDALSCKDSLVKVAGKHSIPMSESTKPESEDKNMPPSFIDKDPADLSRTKSLWVSVRTDLFCIETALRNITREKMSSSVTNPNSSNESPCGGHFEVTKTIREGSSRPEEHKTGQIDDNQEQNPEKVTKATIKEDNEILQKKTNGNKNNILTKSNKVEMDDCSHIVSKDIPQQPLTKPDDCFEEVNKNVNQLPVNKQVINQTLDSTKED